MRHCCSMTLSSVGPSPLLWVRNQDLFFGLSMLGFECKSQAWPGGPYSKTGDYLQRRHQRLREVRAVGTRAGASTVAGGGSARLVRNCYCTAGVLAASTATQIPAQLLPKSHFSELGSLSTRCARSQSSRGGCAGSEIRFQAEALGSKAWRLRSWDVRCLSGCRGRVGGQAFGVGQVRTRTLLWLSPVWAATAVPLCYFQQSRDLSISRGRGPPLEPPRLSMAWKLMTCLHMAYGRVPVPSAQGLVRWTPSPSGPENFKPQPMSGEL